MTHTWSDHRDYVELCDAFKLMDGVTEYINSSMHTTDALNKVLSIQNDLGGEVMVLSFFPFFLFFLFLFPFWVTTAMLVGGAA